MLSRLGTEERLTIAKVGPSPHFTNAPETLLQYLYRDPDAMDRVNVAFTPIFNTTLRLDYSALLELKVRVGKGIERVSENPQLALREFQQYPMLDEQGDGMRSAAAVLIALEAVHRPVTLIDEPEAFLHPPQARALGRHLGTHPGGRQIVISTHSTDL
jgi:predicted ATPase